MNYTKPKFQSPANNKKYRDNYSKVFKKVKKQTTGGKNGSTK